MKKKLSLRDTPDIEFKKQYLETCYQKVFPKFGKTVKIIPKNTELFFTRLFKKVHHTSVGTDYLFNYVCYQFMMKRIRHKVSYPVLTSGRSINQWLEKENDWHVWLGKFKTEFSLQKPQLENEDIDIAETEDNFRKMFFGSVRGFLICLESTSLADPESRFCRRCFKRNDCKEILKANNLELYNKRWQQN